MNNSRPLGTKGIVVIMLFCLAEFAALTLLDDPWYDAVLANAMIAVVSGGLLAVRFQRREPGETYSAFRALGRLCGQIVNREAFGLPGIEPNVLRQR